MHKRMDAWNHIAAQNWTERPIHQERLGVLADAAADESSTVDDDVFCLLFPLDLSHDPLLLKTPLKCFAEGLPFFEPCHCKKPLLDLLHFSLSSSKRMPCLSTNPSSRREAYNYRLRKTKQKTQMEKSTVGRGSN